MDLSENRIDETISYLIYHSNPIFIYNVSFSDSIGDCNSYSYDGFANDYERDGFCASDEFYLRRAEDDRIREVL